jgi:methyltransferase
MVSRLVFSALVALIGVQRLWELRKSRRNEERIRREGGSEHAPGHYKLMVAVHSLWFPLMLAEVWWLERPFIPALAVGALVALAVGQALRYAAMRDLGWRWSVRIFTIPGRDRVATGIYRWVRHPNYVGVVLELAAVPLLHTAWWTALFVSGLNVLVLVIRITAEERALNEASGYAETLGEPSAFAPRMPEGGLP